MINFRTKERLAEQARKAALADELMKNEVLVEAFANIKQAYIDGFINTRPLEQAEREKIWQAIQVLESVQGHLHATIANGKKVDYDFHRKTKGA